MALEVQLEKFRGPLDLLLHLIEKNKVNIYDIPIGLITEQYLEYVRQMETGDLNLVSEFMVMAATLLDIKARMLIPKQEEEETEEDPRAELVARLIEYKTYKYMSLELRDMETDAAKLYYHEKNIPKEVLSYVPPVNLDEILKNVTSEKLFEVFQDVMRRAEDKIDPIRSKFGKIEKEEINLNERISYVKKVTGTQKRLSFRNLLQKQNSKMEVIVTFLAVLELMKTGEVSVVQEHIFDEIQIEYQEKPAAEAVKEESETETYDD